ncbi:DUF805 domain-containing protein [Arenicella xantha]|uniref:Uncharacterized protein n=1 Tax=Arenicella xantha TaxID=644221 RepID=A0A395JHG4_9GAMM|nr:hypothetical protein [Arenicella xantha]RBP48299.1 hypothetical protein DFR28_10828 [Arenicella xantha]
MKAPSADVSAQHSDATCQPKVFTHKDRIDRLRCLAYGLASILIVFPVITLAGALVAVIGSGGENPLAKGLLIAIGVAAYLFLIVFSFIFAKRRFNDMDLSGYSE